MNLTEIRDRVMQKVGLQNVHEVDHEINLVQRQFIQPVARLPGEAYHITKGQQNIKGEELETTDDINYTFAHSPVRRGSLTLYDASGEEIEEDDANYPEVDYDAGTLQFGAVEADVTADYMNVVVTDLADIASGIYRISFVADMTTGTRWQEQALLNDFYTEGYGVRLFNNKLYFHGMPEGRTLLIGYYRRLSDLDELGVREPEIDAQWHDLYWLGAIAMIEPQYYALFMDRLREFKMETIEGGRPDGQRIIPGGWW